jgi:hypothetical protein
MIDNHREKLTINHPVSHIRVSENPENFVDNFHWDALFNNYADIFYQTFPIRK